MPSACVEKMERVVLPEYLDTLPPEHPDAQQNRRDIGLFNFYLGTKGWFVRSLSSCLADGDRLIEVGAGEGRLAMGLRERFAAQGKQGLSWSALDRAPVFAGDNGEVDFVVEDLLHFDAYDRFNVIFGNMILHQFEEDELEQFGQRLQKKARALVFQETLRHPLHCNLCRLATLPMNRVSRHDAVVSIRAGFTGDELPRKLGLDPASWAWTCASTLRGAYRMIAIRK